MIPKTSPDFVCVEVEKVWKRKQNFLTFFQRVFSTQGFLYPFKYPKHAKEAVHILKADKCCNWRAGAQREQEAKLTAK